MQTRLILLRKKLGFKSQKSFAQVISVPWRTLQQYEQGVSQIPSSFLIKLMVQFNISSDWLLSGNGSMFIQSCDHKLKFENDELIIPALTEQEIKVALTHAYLLKIITPLLQDSKSEKIFWRQILESHQKNLSAIVLLFNTLQNLKLETINLKTAKQTLLKTIQKQSILVVNKFKFVLPKDEIINMINYLNDLDCFTIITNAPKIIDALTPFLSSNYEHHLQDQNKCSHELKGL